MKTTLGCAGSLILLLHSFLVRRVIIPKTSCISSVELRSPSSESMRERPANACLLLSSMKIDLQTNPGHVEPARLSLRILLAKVVPLQHKPFVDLELAPRAVAESVESIE